LSRLAARAAAKVQSLKISSAANFCQEVTDFARDDRSKWSSFEQVLIRLKTRQLQSVENEEVVDGETHSEWAVFHHKPGEIFVDWDEVKQEIVAETINECGPNKLISKKPISLKFYSPNVLSLTIVDLPGVTRVPVGDQPLDIGL
jgi:hypothetical protein